MAERVQASLQAACCPDCDAPVPDTATGTGRGGVVDKELSLEWAD
jgi:hypothetical protein